VLEGDWEVFHYYEIGVIGAFIFYFFKYKRLMPLKSISS
jgi:hypothetical protein